MSTMPPAGADPTIAVTFPDGTSATYDQLRDMLDEFHDGELDPATQEKVKYALEHCPRLAQESSVIIGISRLLKNYDGRAEVDPALGLSDDLSSRILGRVRAEPPPSRSGFPWGAVVIGTVTLAVAAGIGLYLYRLNQTQPTSLSLNTPLPAAQVHRDTLVKELRIAATVEASVPSVDVLKGKAVLFTAADTPRELKAGDRVRLADGQRIELEAEALVILTGEGKGTLKIEHAKTSAVGSAQAGKPKIEFQAGRLPKITSVLQPQFMGTQQTAFGYTWRSALGTSDQHFFFLPGLKENDYPARAFEYTGKIYPEGAATEKTDCFDSAHIRWLGR